MFTSVHYFKFKVLSSLTISPPFSLLLWGLPCHCLASFSLSVDVTRSVAGDFLSLVYFCALVSQKSKEEADNEVLEQLWRDWMVTSQMNTSQLGDLREKIFLLSAKSLVTEMSWLHDKI